jgi:outer membrane protein TolC
MSPSHKILAVSACVATWALAAGPTAALARTLDRRSAVRIALAQNPQIAAARAEEAAIAAQGRQVDAARWPMVSLTAGIAPSLKATLVPGTAAQSVESQYQNLHASDLSVALGGDLSVIQPLYTFGKISFRQEAIRHGLRATEAKTRMERADVALAVAQIYEGYLMARDGARFMDETIHWLDSTLQSTEERLAQNVAGVTEREVLRLQAAIGLAEMARHEADAGKAQASAGLAAFLGLPRDEAIVVAEAELLPVGRLPDNFEELLVMANQHRPEVTALVEGGLALEALTRAEAAGSAPDIFIMGLLSVAYTPGRDWLETRFVVDPLNHFLPAALLGLRWQFQGDMAGARAQEQRAHVDGLRHLAAWAEAGIPAEIRRAYEDVRRTRADIESGSRAIGKAKQWVVQASADYSVGFGDVREVSDAVAAYVSLRTAVMKAAYEHNLAMAALAKATGTLDGDASLFYLAPPEEPVAGSVMP